MNLTAVYLMQKTRQDRLLHTFAPDNPAKKTVYAKSKPTSTEMRVMKKLAPNDRGAKGLAAEYGKALVCVRHRLDATGTKRMTTVELIISEKPIARRPGPTVDIALLPKEKALQAKLKAAGARWQASDEVWTIRRSTAIALGLKTRIVPRLP